ncbi:imidazole glycerol phosphate synthase subunit HisH [Bacillus sp. 2205SS5-2]|uniref:imidazole glycerol phosphate synthase subunit HisH n=1 Tax=Bacillus sp. 2205SS5-2 TaxID=3109031 RepID=UPI003006C64F
MIGIIDYGMGNLFSVSKALHRLNIPYFLSESVEELQQADGLILPGVGSFKDAMKLLQEKKIDRLLKNYSASGKPVLGICLGMQLLYEESEENGHTTGLSLLKGKVRHIPKGEVKVPHMGWNLLRYNGFSPLINKLPQQHVYFVHSYYVTEFAPKELLASCSYHVEIPAIVGKENIIGMQFHPEKSGSLGMRLLQNFTELVQKGIVIA